MSANNDGTYEACLAYLDAKGYVLWGDYSLNPNRNDDGSPKNHAAARWLEAQVRGVADHYDTPEAPAPSYAGPLSDGDQRTGKHQAAYIMNPAWHFGKSGRPSALITHGQQPERW